MHASLNWLFLVLIVIGFLFWFVASLPPQSPWSERIARGCFLLAAMIWAFDQNGIA